MKCINKSIVFVTLQFVFGLFLLATTSFVKINLLSGLFVLTGLIVALWGIVAMRKSVLNVFPDVDKKANLVEDGPYRFIRHTMYSGLIFSGLGLLLTDVSLIRVTAYIFLAADLILKLNYEESLLEKHFKNYREYKKKTFRLIPYVY